MHFVKWVVKAAGKDTPWMIDPRPIHTLVSLGMTIETLIILQKQKYSVLKVWGNFDEEINMACNTDYLHLWL
jgi:hypothetical protein